MNRLVVGVAMAVHSLAAGECAATERYLELSLADRDAWATGADDPQWILVDIGSRFCLPCGRVSRAFGKKNARVGFRRNGCVNDSNCVAG